ncbi:hypothetical protein Tco_0458963 [Tanacetum coccineum]
MSSLSTSHHHLLGLLMLWSLLLGPGAVPAGTTLSNRWILETIVDELIVRFGVNVSLDSGFPLNINSPPDEWTNSPSKEWTNSPSEEWTNSPSEEWTNSPSEEWTNSPSEEWTNSPSEEWTNSPSKSGLIRLQRVD